MRRRIGKSVVKSVGSTHKLRLKLSVLSEVEAGGIPGVAVKCVEIGRNTSGEGGLLGFKSTAARLKLKGIDGGPHKQWSMWFNSKQREEPYQVLTSCEFTRDGLVPFGERRDRWCMVVVSSCREMLG